MFENLPDTLTDALAQGIAPWTTIVRRDFHVVVFADAFPVTKGHLLFVPEYPTLAIINDCVSDAMCEGRRMLQNGECDGFNVGINIGESAGQTVKWPHVHLIPRYTGDTPDPIGGVRRVVEGQGNYKLPEYKNPNE